MSTPDNPARRKLLRLAGSSALLLPLAGLPGCGGEEETPPAASDAPPAPESAQPEPSPEPEPAAAAEPAAEPQPAAMPELDPADPQAQALSYVADATSVDGAKFPQYKDGQACVNCALYTGGAGDEWGPCSIFPGKLVNANGWCSVYAPKPG